MIYKTSLFFTMHQILILFWCKLVQKLNHAIIYVKEAVLETQIGVLVKKMSCSKRY